MKRLPFLSVFLFLYPLLTFAGPKDCEFKKAQDILECTVRNHPEVTQSEAARERDIALQKVARQRPNPELESKILTTTDNGASLLSTETSLFHTVEAGGKRKARVRQALAQGELATASFQESKELVTLNTVLSLYRLRQIRSEIQFLDESMQTFDRILKQFRSRPLLPPEQEVSLSLFDLGKEDYRLKKKALVEEGESLKTFLEIATGHTFEEMKGLLPEPKKSWPKISASENPDFKNSELKKAAAEMNLSRANLSLAKSQAWPDFKIGPTIETTDLGNDTQMTVGGSLSLPLPLFNRNRGNKTYAALDQKRATLNLESVQRKTAAERAKQWKRYKTALQGTPQIPAKDLENKHHQVDTFFTKGLVPSSLVIEAHRRIFDIKKSFHEQELTALDALWRIYIIDGRLSEEKL